MNEEQMRAEFEAWYRDKFCKTLSGMATDEMMYIVSNGEYSSFHVRGAWEGWQAAIAFQAKRVRELERTLELFKAATSQELHERIAEIMGEGIQ